MKIKSEVLKEINKQGVSIVIGARNEHPQIAMTITSLMEDMHACGITKWEIILMDNGSEDNTSKFFAWRETNADSWLKSKKYVPASQRAGKVTYMYSPRGLVNEGKLRIFFDPIYSNVGTRNKGTKHAKYDNVIFSDAHQIIRTGTIYYTLETLIKHKGIVHAPIAWMGASSEKPDAGYQYSYKVGEKIWGTWNKVKVSENPFYIPICGHAWIAVKKKQFLEFKGYPLAQRVYGGGEPYLDTKYWMMGSTSMMDPRGLVYHLSAGRGYSWTQLSLIFNMMLVSYIMGGEKWSERILITYLNKSGTNTQLIKWMYGNALKEGKKDHDWLEKNRKKTFEEVVGLDRESEIRKLSREELGVLDEEWYCRRCTKRGYPDPHVMRPWDYENDKLHGKHRSFTQEFVMKRDDKGDVYVGNTKITHPDALKLASKYV